MDIERLEEWSSHLGKQCFQVSADAPERKLVEVRKCDLGSDRHMRQLPLDIMLGNRGTKAYLECLQLE